MIHQLASSCAVGRPLRSLVLPFLAYIYFSVACTLAGVLLSSGRSMTVQDLSPGRSCVPAGWTNNPANCIAWCSRRLAACSTCCLKQPQLSQFSSIQLNPTRLHHPRPRPVLDVDRYRPSWYSNRGACVNKIKLRLHNNLFVC